jgi:hypothetical protein
MKSFLAKMYAKKKSFLDEKKNIKNTLMWEKKIFSISFLAFKIIS